MSKVFGHLSKDDFQMANQHMKRWCKVRVQVHPLSVDICFSLCSFCRVARWFSRVSVPFYILFGNV